MALINADLTTTAAAGLVPPGKYTLQVIESEVCATKAGTGQYIKFTFEILDGEYRGKRIYSNCNFANPNETAQRLGREWLKSLATYSGHPNPNVIRDTQELHGRPVIGSVIVKDGGEYADSNEIKGFAKVAGQPAAAPPAPAAPAAAPAPAPAAPAPVAQPAAPANAWAAPAGSPF